TTPTEEQCVKILSLKALEAFHIDNIGRVRNLLKQANLNTLSGVTLFSLVTIISVGLYILCRRKENVTLQVNATPLQPELIKNGSPVVHPV
ncbi:hypothetical protein KR018_000831, partial [Drosophila ironensis]